MRPGGVTANLLLPDDLGGIHGDHQLLVGGDQEDLDLGIGGGEDGFLAADVVGLLVQLQAQELEALTSARTPVSFSPTPAVKTTASTPPMAAA